MTERPKNPNHTLLDETNLSGEIPELPRHYGDGRGLPLSKGQSLA